MIDTELLQQHCLYLYRQVNRCFNEYLLLNTKERNFSAISQQKANRAVDMRLILLFTKPMHKTICIKVQSP